MKFSHAATDQMILSELGRRLAQARLGKQFTQKYLAERAGVSKRTVERLESGEVAPQLTAFVRICRALELVERFERLVPESGGEQPLSDGVGGQNRQRASGGSTRDGAGSKKGADGRSSVRGRRRAAGADAVDVDQSAMAAGPASLVVVVHELN